MSEQSCETRDLALGGRALLIVVPPCRLAYCWFELAKGSADAVDSCIAGHGRAACIGNAARCGRRHCYVTGPVYLLAALYVALSALNLVPMHPGVFLFVVFGITAVACLAEGPFGKYIRKVSKE
jgi:hypothetical protein